MAASNRCINSAQHALGAIGFGVARTGEKNLLDRNYYYQEGLTEAGRNWNLAVRYRF